MTGKTATAIFATTVAAAAVSAMTAAAGPGPADPIPADTLAYRVPSPPTAVYHGSTSVTMSIGTAMGPMNITGEGTFTLDIAFEDHTDGLRVTGAVSSFEGSGSNPMGGTQSFGLDAVTGSLDLVIDHRGEAEIASTPDLQGLEGGMSPFTAINNAIFPLLPDGAVEPGATWMDGDTVSTNVAGIETTTTAVSTYTLVGDTVADGRSLTKIAVATEMTVEGEGNAGGMSISQTMSGTITGVILWDAERGLVSRSDTEQSLEGSMSMPGMPSSTVSMTGSGSVRLENR